jgi:ElaB/YqjD/DUF883 family membrane-anchored ribosome-binding protein
MTPTTIEANLKAPLAKARQEAERVSEEARRLAARAGEVIDDTVKAARRSARKAKLRAVDARHEMEHRIKRQPLAAVVLAAGAGLLLGIALVGCRRR